MCIESRGTPREWAGGAQGAATPWWLWLDNARRSIMLLASRLRAKALWRKRW